MLDSKPKLSNPAHLGIGDVRWLENWSGLKISPSQLGDVAQCAWIVPNPDPIVPGKPPAKVKEAFDKNEYAEFPRVPQSQ